MINKDYIFLLAKARNLCYYCSIDTRPRATYIHIVRSLRKDMKKVLSQLEQGTDEFNYVLELIKSCPQKIKAEECRDYIINKLTPLIYGKKN